MNFLCTEQSRISVEFIEGAHRFAPLYECTMQSRNPVSFDLVWFAAIDLQRHCSVSVGIDLPRNE